jgi:hypothetical protein
MARNSHVDLYGKASFGVLAGAVAVSGAHGGMTRHRGGRPVQARAAIRT